MDVKRFTRSARLVLGLALASGLTFAAVGPASAAGIIYVRQGSGGANNGTSWANAYHDLQSALAAAGSGDQIWVAAGVYFPTTGSDRTVTFTLKTGVAVYGGFAGTETLLGQRKPAIYVTILSGDIGNGIDVSDNSNHVVSSGGSDNTAILDGFTITAGNANVLYNCYTQCGGGIYVSSGSPTLKNLVVTGNGAIDGGGMYNAGSPTLKNLVISANGAASGGGMLNAGSPTLIDVTFSANSASGSGGGMENTGVNSPTLTNVTFSANTAAEGGGLYNDQESSPIMTNVTFSGNSALRGGGMISYDHSNPVLTHVVFTANSAASYGGGMYTVNTSAPALTDVVFMGNEAAQGGGMYNEITTNSPTLTNVTFEGNWGRVSGGGMENYGSSPKLTNVIFSFNSSSGPGGAMYNRSGSKPTLSNVTFSGNYAANGGAVFDLSSTPTLTNVTFKSNTAGADGGAMSNVSSSPVVHDAVFWGDSTEVFNFSAAPVFVDSVIQGGCPPGSGTCTHILNADPKLGPLQNNGGLTKTMALGAGSAAIDAGGANSTCASKDQRGVTRPQGGKCDIGAYEVKAAKFTSAATYDGWVLESTESSGVGGSMNSAGSTILIGDDAANKQYRGVLSFNTSTLPDAASVILGKVKVRKAAIVGTDPFTTHGALTLSLKKPYFGTAVGLEIGDFQAAATVASAGTIGPTLVSGWYTGLLNSAAQAAVNNTGTTQLRLGFKLDDNNDHAADYLSLSSGNATSTYRPVLILYYNP